MAMTEDFTAFFNVAEFADPATLGGAPVIGILDKDYLLEDLGGGMATSGPVFTLASAAVPSVVAGLSLVVNGLTYKVVEPMPDGTGVTALRLRT